VLQLRFPHRALLRPEEIVRLFALVDLGLNRLVVPVLAQIFELNRTLAKILAVFPMFASNYRGRRKLVFDGSLSRGWAPAASRHDSTLPDRLKRSILIP
jgi:hypothetical protein